MLVREGGCAASSPCVVLLHDWRLGADLNWFATYERLAIGHRLVALDHRGHGRGIRSEPPSA
jgi:3-oxoadipate enol-lactonase